MKPLIEFINLSKIYEMGENIVRAVDDISFQIMPGEFVAIVGQSGSGKSTCMNIIGCLDIPTAGTYLLDGQDVSTIDDDALAEVRNKMIGFIFQQYNLLPKLSVLGNVELPLIYSGLDKSDRKSRATQVITKVGLLDKLNNLPSQLSGGQQQRVSIARALASAPSVILADEPTGALDSKTGKEVIELLKQLNAEGNTVVLITHDNAIAAQAQRIIRLADGKIVPNEEEVIQV
jgi:putative ABC transport system ATP-binding protein